MTIHDEFLKFLYRDSPNHWLPWKEYPLYCPKCKKEVYFVYNNTKLVGYSTNKSQIVYICPNHLDVTSTLTFNHDTDESI